MPDSLLGVIIGGAIALLGQSIILFLNYHRWKKERKLDYLQNKRINLEKLFSKLNAEAKSAKFDNISSDVITDFLYLCPDIVVDAFNQYMEQLYRADENKHADYFNVSSAMKIAISEIESNIEKIIL